MQNQKIAINGKRLEETIERFADFGRTDNNGVTRLALSDEDVGSRNYLVECCEALGLHVTKDDLGNQYARFEGSDPKADPVYVGSHLDSVKKGGRYDGALGVIAALEVIRTMIDYSIQPKRPIILVNFTNEEGARFEPSMMSSGVLSGKFNQEEMNEKRDQNGVTFLEALKESGYEGKADERLTNGKAFLELHIEQGPVLEQEEITIGAVECVVGMVCYEIEVLGDSNHAGTTPMAMRDDALFTAVDTIQSLRNRLDQLDERLVYTIGRIEASPNIHTVIPNRIVFSLEARHQDEEIIDKVEQIIHSFKERNRIEPKRLWQRDTVWFDSAVVKVVEEASKQLGTTHRRMVSGAGHDAQFIASMMPTAMIFVPSLRGKSHSEDEYTSPKDCIAGVNVLFEAVSTLSQE
ncbi:Zn-dependent hydrolase [Geomicrobium sediminis]|uniref:N-carbamoyl-L-amino-acid hydrolase n=1 Tax=Geomicrobium sediminis TaxID=1347788 RepID=A0ABS2PHN9_9BACL|nr:Zn-dependent hydrolase [Geomicrobium sediminis]MBM7634953.1 N-carbamoyl-L-amino-acid hydrolase [Geomicrobium sediminis]